MKTCFTILLAAALLPLVVMPQPAAAQPSPTGGRPGGILDRARQRAQQQQQQQPYRGPLDSIWGPNAERERQQQEAETQAVASQQVDDIIFLPDHGEQLATYLSAQGKMDNGAVRACTDRLDAQAQARQRAYGYRPMPAAEQIRLGEEGKIAYAACNRQGDMLASSMARMTAVLTRWTDRLPATSASLVTINKAYFGYGYSLGNAGEGGRQAIAVAQSVLNRRRNAIETAIRPALFAEINQPGKEGLVFDMFSTDSALQESYNAHRITSEFTSVIPAHGDKSPPFYRTALPEWRSKREAGTAPAAWTEPTGEEIGYAILRTMKAYGGRQLSPFAVTMPNVGNRFGSNLLDGIAPLSLQLHDVRRGGCRREASGYRCQYALYKRAMLPDATARDPLWVMFYKAMNASNGGTASTLFVPTRGGWRMPELEQAIDRAHANQLEGLTTFLNGAVNAGANAFSVMQDVGSSSSSGANGGKSRAEQEQDDRMRENEERARRPH